MAFVHIFFETHSVVVPTNNTPIPTIKSHRVLEADCVAFQENRMSAVHWTSKSKLCGFPHYCMHHKSRVLLSKTVAILCWITGFKVVFTMCWSKLQMVLRNVLN